MQSDHIKLFWLGHECGHAFLRTANETQADCWSATTGVRQGWFDESDAEELERSLRSNPGDQTHPPGPVRAANVKNCVMTAGSANARTTSSRAPLSDDGRQRSDERAVSYTPPAFDDPQVTTAAGADPLIALINSQDTARFTDMVGKNICESQRQGLVIASWF